MARERMGSTISIPVGVYTCCKEHLLGNDLLVGGTRTEATKTRRSAAFTSLGVEEQKIEGDILYIYSS